MGLRDIVDNNDDDRRRYRDFADRYERGPIHEGYDDDEARRHYSRFERDMDDDDFERSARATFERMDPSDRRQYSRELRRRGRERGHDFGRDDDDDDPSVLAGMLRGARKKESGGLGGLLGGGDGDGMGTMGKVLMGGIAAMAAREVFKDR
jgi:hypothetical protein